MHLPFEQLLQLLLRIYVYSVSVKTLYVCDIYEELPYCM